MKYLLITLLSLFTTIFYSQDYSKDFDFHATQLAIGTKSSNSVGYDDVQAEIVIDMIFKIREDKLYIIDNDKNEKYTHNITIREGDEKFPFSCYTEDGTAFMFDSKYEIMTVKLELDSSKKFYKKNYVF